MPEVKHNPGKWAQRAAAASGDYLAGVRNPRRDWADATEAAEDNFEAGINEAISEKRFSKGVRDAGSTKWKKGVEDKGRTRFQSGVSVSENEYDKGFSPYARVIESVQLKPRGPKGTNYGRVQEIGEALRNAKKNI